jgi:hypothetical protein
MEGHMELALKIRNFSHFEADCGLRREDYRFGKVTERPIAIGNS